MGRCGVSGWSTKDPRRAANGGRNDGREVGEIVGEEKEARGGEEPKRGRLSRPKETDDRGAGNARPARIECRSSEERAEEDKRPVNAGTPQKRSEDEDGASPQGPARAKKPEPSDIIGGRIAEAQVAHGQAVRAITYRDEDIRM